MAKSEILYIELPEWSITLGSRRVRVARIPHRCAIGDHEIPAGTAYSRVTHLIDSKVVTTAMCGLYCPHEDNLTEAERIEIALS